MQRDNPIVAAFYHSKVWEKTRNAYYKSKYGMCERCGTCNGKMIVHHKTHVTSANVDNPDITLDFGNLELLCIECHNNEHYNSDGWTFDENGNLIAYKKD